MFKDPTFEAGCEFKNDFLSNIYSRLFLPKNTILREGDNFSELMMIQQGCLDVNISYSIKEYGIDGQQFRFFLLPTYSYVGDY